MAMLGKRNISSHQKYMRNETVKLTFFHRLRENFNCMVVDFLPSLLFEKFQRCNLYAEKRLRTFSEDNNDFLFSHDSREQEVNVF